jgi:hypothetical protein
MPSPVRYTAGVSTASKGTPLANYPGPDPMKVFTYSNDFDNYVAGDWTVTAVGASTAAMTDGAFGRLLLTTAGAENDGVQLQKVGEAFLPIANKKMWFKTKFQVSDATESDFLFGIAVTDTTALAASGDGVTDGIFFQKDDGSTSVTLYCMKDTTTGQTSAASVATIVAATDIELGFEWDGVSVIKYFVDGVHKGTLDLTTTPATYLPDTECRVTMAFLTGAAAAKTCSIDYIFAAIER